MESATKTSSCVKRHFRYYLHFASHFISLLHRLFLWKVCSTWIATRLELTFENRCGFVRANEHISVYVLFQWTPVKIYSKSYDGFYGWVLSGFWGGNYLATNNGFAISASLDKKSRAFWGSGTWFVWPQSKEIKRYHWAVNRYINTIFWRTLSLKDPKLFWWIWNLI